MRLFIAIPLGDATRGSLVRAVVRVRDERDEAFPVDRFRWVAREQFHVTVRFLGDVTDPNVLAVIDACRQVRLAALPSLRVERLMLAPARGVVRLIVGEVGGDLDVFRDAFNQLEAALSEVGFRREGRPFWPHVTVARARSPVHLTNDQRAAWAGRANAVSGLPAGTLPGLFFTVDRLQVVESRLEAGGAIHTPIATLRLDV